MNIVKKYNLRAEILKNLDIVQKYESGWFDMDYGDESHDEGFWDLSYEIAITYDSPDQEKIYYELKELCKEMIYLLKYSNTKLVVASKSKKKMTPVQKKEYYDKS
tara:strand:+ start:3240 stop:3554 length:315 start_codon:yes stop_codon:yes gene_type:complete